MDTHSKERLTGAVILVAVVVLLVPELLSGPSRSAPPPADAEAEPLRSYTIDLTESRRRPATPRAPAPVPASTRPAEPAEEAQPVRESVAAPAQEDGKDEPAAQAPAAAAQEAGSSPKSEAAAPRSSGSADPAPKPAPEEEGGWFVQVGSFASQDNAHRLSEQLQAKGFRAFVTRSTTGRRLYRVRVGPESDRAAAQALAERLRRAGQTGSIVSSP